MLHIIKRIIKDLRMYGWMVSGGPFCITELAKLSGKLRLEDANFFISIAFVSSVMLTAAIYSLYLARLYGDTRILADRLQLSFQQAFEALQIAEFQAIKPIDSWTRDWVLYQLQVRTNAHLELLSDQEAFKRRFDSNSPFMKTKSAP